jgi:hypothetical protein
VWTERRKVAKPATIAAAIPALSPPGYHVRLVS